jgi:hypothetical protein
MKKIFSILILCAVIAPVSAQDTSWQTEANRTFTPGTHKYYYYPSTNIYFDEANGNYSFKDNPSSATWKRTRTLPSTFKPGKGLRYKLNYKGIDPWKNNKVDIIKYKVNPKGKVISKKNHKKDEH